jgi:hypothetical protein
MGGIYLIQEGGGLVEMPETAYDSEALLQELLARYPNLLAGDQIDSAAPRQWLLIAREVPLPSEEGGAGRWSVDHIFLDQDAVPTLVEIKRSTDTRIRREVVGQMLDYAANAVVYWPVGQMQARFERQCSDDNHEPDEVLLEFLGADADLDQFWQQAKTNLQAGKVRIVFVVDKIPTELQRIVEFLNAQMDPAQVLAVEVKQFVGQGQKAMVPRVLGQTAEAQQKKSTPHPPGRQWDEEMFFRALEDRNEPRVTAAARRILQWWRDRGLDVTWGKGKTIGTFNPAIYHAELRYRFISVRTDGRFEVSFFDIKSRPPFDDEVKRRELWERLNQVGGMNISADRRDTWAEQPLAALTDDVAMQQFLNTLDWFVQEVRAS